jgi:putative FmdB family regulatory protein
MPIYEYRCEDCRRQVSLLVLRISNPETPHCPRCGGEHLTRLLSRFARLRSEDDRLESLADPSSLGNLDENDPQSVARWMKKMGGELGEDAGEDWDSMVDEALDEEAAGEEGAPAE